MPEMRSIDLLALTAQSGLPLFSRRVTNASTSSLSPGTRSPITMIDDEMEHISLNTIATLYGLNLFARLNEAQIHQAETTDGRVAIHWRCFADHDEAAKANLVLILVAKNIDGELIDLSSVLELVFKMILMVCGPEEVASTNVERLKGSLRLTHSGIDYLLRAAIGNNLTTLELASQSITYAFTSRSSFICSIVNTIASSVSSEYCALFAHGRLLSASKAWLAKFNSTNDAFRLTCLLNSLMDTELIHTKEIPIYLPSIDSSRHLRLIVSQVTREIKLCLLIASNNDYSLDRIETEVIVPLNDTKLQEEKLARYIFGSKNSENIPASILASILGPNVVLIERISGFVFWNFARRLHFVYNETKVEENVDLILVLAGANDHLLANKHQTIKYPDRHFCYDQLALYQVSDEGYRLTVLFEPSTAMPTSTAVESMCTTTHELAAAIVKAKHLWL